MAVESSNQSREDAPDTVEMPAPTAWPIVLAFGITLLFAGMVTSEAVSVLGAILAIAGAVGWFRDVLPHEAHESVPVVPQVPAVTTMRREVARVEIAHELQRAWLPLEIYPISAGIKGGLAGSVAMAVLAMLYGILSQNGIWYPINLLAAGFFPAAMTETTAQLAAFHLRRLADRRSDSPDHVAAGRVALRRDAADASAAADSAGRLHRAASCGPV